MQDITDLITATITLFFFFFKCLRLLTLLILKCQNTGTKMGTNHINKQSNMLMLLFVQFYTKNTRNFCCVSPHLLHSRGWTCLQQHRKKYLEDGTHWQGTTYINPLSLKQFQLLHFHGLLAEQAGGRKWRKAIVSYCYFIFLLSFLDKWTVEKKYK